MCKANGPTWCTCMYNTDTHSHTTSVVLSQQGKTFKNERIRCRLWPQTPKRPLHFLLSYGAMQLPVIYLLSEHVGPFAWHSSACPPQHMKAPATAVLDGGKWVPDGKVFCVYAYVCVTCHIRECFYCTSGLSHIPRVMWGRLAGWWGTCGCSLLYLKARLPSTEQLVCTGHVYVHARACTRVLIIALMRCEKLHWIPRQQQKEFYNLATDKLPALLCICAASWKFNKGWRLLITL